MTHRLTTLVLAIALLLATALPALAARNESDRSTRAATGWTTETYADGALDVLLPLWVVLR